MANYAPDKLHYTWMRRSPDPIFVRLDYFIISELVFQSVTHSDIIPSYKSDHSIPMLDIDFTTNKRGPGYWKFNSSLLEDPVFVDELHKVLEIEIAQEYRDIKLKWEMIKVSIRNYTLKYSACKNKAKKQ